MSLTIFNRSGDGADELVRAIGIIGADISFDKWAPILPLGTRDVCAVIGREPVEALAEVYAAGGELRPEWQSVLYLQQAVALFTWLKIIPTLDAQHDNTGRARRLGENEKGLTALQEYKDEANILRMAYEALDALIEEMELHGFDFWTGSTVCRRRSGLLLRTKEQFDVYYTIGSHRLFVTLLPMITEAQTSDVAPILGPDLLNDLLAAPSVSTPLHDTACRAVALLAIKKAVERLPVEVLPEGIVQINQSQPVNSRLRAEREARTSVAASLGTAAAQQLMQLQTLVAELTATDSAYIPNPLVHSRGMSF